MQLPPRFKSSWVKKFSTFDADGIVEMANKHIDHLYKNGLKPDDAFFHELSIALSKINTKQKHGGPFGAVIVKEKDVEEKGRMVKRLRVIGVGTNHVVPNNDPSAHAEMVAYRDAARREGSSDLEGAILYTSCECCPMCLSIANASGIGRISYINTRAQAADIEFSDKLQYEMFRFERYEQMQSIRDVAPEMQRVIHEKLGAHGAVVLDKDYNVIGYGSTDASLDPTGVASLNAVRDAVKKYAQQERDKGNDAPIFCVPEGCTLVCRDKPHPAGLVTADWARVLRDRDPNNAGNPNFDSKIPIASRIVHISDAYERLAVGTPGHLHQDAEVTYLQPILPINRRAVDTDRFDRPDIAKAALDVFHDWKRRIYGGRGERY